MELSSAAKVALIMNNYFHDLATGVLVGSAFVMWVLGRQAAARGREAQRFFAGAFPLLSRIALFAIAWIVIGGIPRTIFFSQVEWDPALVNGLVPALIVKHVLMFAALALGVGMWLRMRAVARGIMASPDRT
jgi:uncharacterized membrane protein YGL010W